MLQVNFLPHLDELGERNLGRAIDKKCVYRIVDVLACVCCVCIHAGVLQEVSAFQAECVHVCVTPQNTNCQ